MKKHLTAALCLLLAVLVLAGCGKKADLSPEAQKLVGKWAYDYEPETAVLILNQNGSAEYDGKKYDRFTYDSEFLELSFKDGPAQQIRCLTDEKGMLLFRRAEYECDGTHEGLIGNWKDEEDKWSFQFTNTNAFLEDGLFPGTFYVDEANGSILLRYAGGELDDTVCYYTIEGDTLILDYPWRMVPVE